MMLSLTGQGLNYLADIGIIHRDVALRNILLTNNDVVKVLISLLGRQPCANNKTMIL